MSTTVDGGTVETEDAVGRRLLRVFGPPGTGKTTTLADRVKRDVRRLGPESTLIASFTNTAAEEIRGRGLGLAKGYCGTLHSHAYRVCGHPAVALDSKVIEDWNSSAPGDWKVTGASRGGLTATDKATPSARATSPDQAVTGDELLAALDLLRARAVSPSEWPSNVRAFAKRWTQWKDSVEALDFSDMIVQAYRRARDGEGPPGNPKRFILDEAQDNTPVEIALALEWAQHVEVAVFAFDDDQAINQWRGGDPTRLLGLVDGPAPNDTTVGTEVLAQSYRVPPAVHAVAQRWVERIESRYAKQYLPREPDASRGDVTEADGRGYAYRAGYDLDDPALADAVEADLDAGETPMVLASCGYMLAGLLRTLRMRGVPFHNPYRPADGAWNPLGNAVEGTMSTSERIYRFLVADRQALPQDWRRWTGEDIEAWSDLLSTPTAGMVRGASKIIKNLPRGEVPWELVAGLWKPGEPAADGSAQASMDLARAVAADLEWFAGAVVPNKAARTAYPLQVARSRGPAALLDERRVVVGTIHSVKGATASKVYLAPDLSAAGMRQWQSPDATLHDQIRRLMYVAVTRAFRTLVVLTPSGPNTVDPAALVPTDLEVRP